MSDVDGDGFSTLAFHQYTNLVTTGQRLTDSALNLRVAQTPEQITQALQDAFTNAHALGLTMNIAVANELPNLMWTWQQTHSGAGTQQQFEVARDAIADSVQHLANVASTATIKQSVPLTQTLLAQEMLSLTATAQTAHQTLQPPPAAEPTDEPDDDQPDGTDEF